MTVSSRLRIFVSVGPDLEAEREVVGETIASLPVSLGWVIRYTPGMGEPPRGALEAVAACQFYVLLMGSDIRAPVGAELQVARKRSKQVLAALKDIPRTPAAQVFIKDVSLDWQRFHNQSELGFLLRHALAEQLLENAVVYGISPVDWETLSALLAELKHGETPESEQDEMTPRRRGAGSDAVIVAPSRDLPSDGVFMEPP